MPSLRNFIRKTVTRPTRRAVMPLYESYDEALEACQGPGYEDTRVIDIVVEKTKIYCDKYFKRSPVHIQASQAQILIPLLISLFDQGNGILQVIDFGGAAGFHYFVIKNIFPTRRFRWYVVETPAMVTKAKALETDEICFFSDLESARQAMPQVDVIYSSGTLSYVKQPYETLRGLIACNATSIVLARSALTTANKDLITVHKTRVAHHGPGSPPDACPSGVSRIPFQFMRQQELERILRQNYEIQVQLEDSSGVFQVNDEPVLGVSYLGSKRKP